MATWIEIKAAEEEEQRAKREAERRQGGGIMRRIVDGMLHGEHRSAAWRRELLKGARRDFFDAGVLSLAHACRGQHPLPTVLKWHLAMILSLNAGRSEREGALPGCSGSSGGSVNHWAVLRLVAQPQPRHRSAQRPLGADRHR